MIPKCCVRLLNLPYLYLAEGYLKHGLYNESQEIYRLIQSVYPTSPLLIYAQDGSAWASFLNENYPEATEIREQIQKTAQQKDLPEDVVLVNRYELANALFNQKKYLKALDIFDVFYKQHPQHYLAVSSCFRAGLCYYQLEYFAQAIEIWEQLVINYPDAPETREALWKVADTYFRAQVYDKAIQTYKKISERYAKNDEESAKAYLRIAQCHYNSKNIVLAIQSLKELIEKFSSESQSYEALDLLTTFLEIPDSKDSVLLALEDIVKSLGKKTPLAVEIRFRLAQNFFEDKNYPRTIEILEDLTNELREGKRFADSSYYLAESYYQTSEFDKAVLVYERFVDNFPEDKRAVTVLFRLGLAYFKMEKFDNSVRVFEKFAENYPDTQYSASALYNMALAYRKLDKWEKAISTLQIYQKKYPQEANTSGIEADLVAIYEEQNQYIQAIKILETSRDKIDKETEKWNELTFRIAENYMASGDKQKGINEYQKLISNTPSQNVWALNAMIRVGEYYEKNGELEKAISLYEKSYQTAENMPQKPSWFEAIKALIESIRIEIELRRK